MSMCIHVTVKASRVADAPVLGCCQVQRAKYCPAPHCMVLLEFMSPFRQVIRLIFPSCFTISLTVIISWLSNSSVHPTPNIPP
jgi:hypothetical protein